MADEFGVLIQWTERKKFMRDLSHLKLVMCGYDKDEVSDYIKKIDDEYYKTSRQQTVLVDSLADKVQRMEDELNHEQYSRLEAENLLLRAREQVEYLEKMLREQEGKIEFSRECSEDFYSQKAEIENLLSTSRMQVTKILESAKRKHDIMISDTQKECEDMLNEARIIAAAVIADAKQDANNLQRELRGKIGELSATMQVLRGVSNKVTQCCDFTESIIENPESFFKELETLTEKITDKK